MNDNTAGWERLFKYMPVVLVLLAVFLLSQTLNTLKEYKYIGSGPQSNTITVSGEGEVFAVPDIAEFSFSVIEESKDVNTAQKNATEKMNKAIESLKNQGIEEKDIKTIGYNVYPKYDYQRSICNEFSCPPSKQVLLGYEVNHSIRVKVRNLDEAGSIIGSLGALNVSNISGVSFTIDDEDVIANEAREKAIKDAREKAKSLSKDLGVKLVRIVSFSENNFGRPTALKFDSAMLEAEIGGGEDIAPSLPQGENRVVSNVTVTYEIR